jgi:2',3'-cyclic-nucleotide 2'-phosphodiesterase (5'-nucleotidase family)
MGLVTSRRVVATLFVLASCSGPATAPSASSTALTSPSPEASAAVRTCEGNVDRGFNVNVTPQIADVPGGRRITLFFGTHTHGMLVRSDGVTFANYVGLLNTARGQLPDPSHSLFLGNGDDLASGFCATHTGGRHVIDAFNAAHLDADTYGFNEIAADVSGVTPTELRELVAASQFAWLSANVFELDGSDVFAKAQGARRWVIRDVGGIKVGLTGLIVPEPVPGFTPPSYGRDLVVIDPVDAMRDVVPQLRAAGAELVVVLSHMDGPAMERVARETTGIDAIVGSHIGMQGRATVVNGVILSDGHDNMHGLAQLDLVLKDSRVVAYAFGIRTASRAVAEDASVAAALERYLAKR